MKKTITLTTLLVLLVTTAFAQGKAEDYERAFGLGRKYSNKMTHGNVSVRGERDGKFRYSVYDGDSTVWYEVNARTGEKAVTAAPPARKQQPSAHHWMEVLDEKDGSAVSPVDSSLCVVFRDNNLFLRNKTTKEDVQLTFDGTETCYYSSWGTWSEDGKRYATVMIKPAPKHFVTYTLSSPATQVQPIYKQQEYAKPGDSLNIRIPVIVTIKDDATGKPEVTKPEDDSWGGPQYYVSAPEWDKGGKTVTFEYNGRGHKVFRVLEMDLKGKVRTLIEEKNDKYVAYSRNLRRNLSDGNILWKSDRDGRAHLYLLDRKKGRLTQVTKGDFWVRDVLAVEEGKKGYIIFTANGRGCANMGRVASSLDGSVTEEDPYNVHAYRIGLDGKGLTSLTPEKANHKVTYNHGAKTIVDTYSTLLMPPVTVLRDSRDGKVIAELEKADITRLEKEGWQAPEVFVAPGRDGKTDMWGVIQRPSNFDPTKKYPVIEYIYSGPGSQYVPKDFTPMLWRLADIAELGFIVVQLDAMTTSYRTLDFEQVCYKNLKDAGFPDRIAWIKAAAEKYPYMDTERVGIYGASAGGQEALGALLFHPEFYKAGYAACGCHDNRMDKIWWNEQWMGWPVDSSYIESSNVENAHLLQGKLMLVVGEMDDNVDPSSSYQVVNALVKAGKDFEFIYLPGAAHTMGEAYGEHKRYDFFVKSLLGVEPPQWNEIGKK